MWRLYCRDKGEGQGVSVQSTLGRIKASVADHELIISPIRYRYYHEGPAFDDELDPSMHKRQGFEYEREVRILKYDQSHYFELVAVLMSDDPSGAEPPELPEHIFLDWSPSDVIDKITISPYATREYETSVKDAIASIDLSLREKVELSVLSERRYNPYF
jgi:hypothetical protein